MKKPLYTCPMDFRACVDHLKRILSLYYWGASLGTISIQAHNVSCLNSNENMSSFTEILRLWPSLPRMCEAIYGPEQLGKPHRNQQGLVSCGHSAAVQLWPWLPAGWSQHPHLHHTRSLVLWTSSVHTQWWWDILPSAVLICISSEKSLCCEQLACFTFLLAYIKIPFSQFAKNKLLKLSWCFSCHVLLPSACLPLSKPENGGYTCHPSPCRMFSHGTVIEFFCDSGFVLSGDYNYLTCQDGQWDGPMQISCVSQGWSVLT